MPAGARIADVGTDHGLLPLWLLENGIAVSAVATDIRPGPLSRAEQHRRERGVTAMRCVLCDGLEKVAPEEADTVIIAGMGGENMAQILQNAPWTAAGALLLLQPMTHPEILRAALHRMGIRITGEHLVLDSGRIYPVISANSGADEEYLPGELYMGRYKLVSGEALFPDALESWRRKTDEVIAGLERSRKPDDLPRLNHMRAVRRDLEEMRRMYDADRS